MATDSFSGLSVVAWATADVKPYEKNPRINDSATDAVAASIKAYGFRQPIVVDPAGVIICGHTRWKAAQKLGLETGAGPCGDRPLARADPGLSDRRQQDLRALDLGLRPAAHRAG